MNVLIVNISDLEGGAAKASYRLHQSLLSHSINSKMLVYQKESDDFTVDDPKGMFKKLLCKLSSKFEMIPLFKYKRRKKVIFSSSLLSLYSVIDDINSHKPDIVHLHWICGGMLKIKHLERINASVIWSLHDMWPFTGGCHYSEGCIEYKNNCGNCDILKSGRKNDLSFSVLQKKKKSYQLFKNLTVVGLSSWITNCAQNSNVFNSSDIINLPNPIDTSLYQCIDKIEARKLLGISQHKKIILFGAMSATSDARKGYKELKKALEHLNSDEYELVVFGSSKPEKADSYKFPVNYIGRLFDDYSIISLYSAADVMVVPSLEENLSNAIMESLSCSTPVVAFKIGGNGDMIKHKENGYLAEPKNSKDLADGIDWILNNENYDELCIKAREIVERNFESSKVGAQYIKLYESVLNKNE